MDRRAFLCGTGGAALATVWSGLPDWVRGPDWSDWFHASDVPGGPGPSRVASGAGAAALADSRVAVFDASLVEGRALAHLAARLGMPAWEPGDDVGALWHAQLAQRLPPRTLLISALRSSDRFVLTRLAATRGCTLLPASLPALWPTLSPAVMPAPAPGSTPSGPSARPSVARTGKRDSSDRT